MLHISFTDEEVETFNYERYHYPDPKVQMKFEVLWLKRQGLAHEAIARLAGVSTRTVQRYLNEYIEGGCELIKQNNYTGSDRRNGDTEEMEEMGTFRDVPIISPLSPEASFNV